ncbi:MAG: LysE family transporter [Bacteroidales bacterium]|nr:LysE family transporter [Bacteroidales bacterium]
MLIEFLKCFLIGICASAPLGPVAIFVMQRSLAGGHRAGFLTGLGATLTDTIWATVAIFALAIAEDFIFAHETVILIGGGIILSGMGFSMAFKDPFRRMKDQKSPDRWAMDFWRTALLGLSNPGAIAVMLALFAFFGVQVEDKGISVVPCIAAVSLGSAVYWFNFSWLFGHLRRNFKMRTLVWMNRISGLIVLIIGSVLLIRGLVQILSQ